MLLLPPGLLSTVACAAPPPASLTPVASSPVSAMLSRRSLAHCLAASAFFAYQDKAWARGVDEAARVLDEVKWDDEVSFTREDFRRLDETDDGAFYSEPRFVTHVDDAAVAATQRYYDGLFTSLRSARGEPLDVLDLGSSWVSHFPPNGLAAGGALYRRVAGLGMNQAELSANKVLTEIAVQDLNKQPKLPYADAAFDVVTCTVSIDYLTKPLEVMAEAARVLRPGGVVAIVFSDRLFFSKAVALWTGKAPSISAPYRWSSIGSSSPKPRALGGRRGLGGALTWETL